MGDKNGILITILIEIKKILNKIMKYSLSQNTKIQTIKEKIYEYTQFPPDIQ